MLGAGVRQFLTSGSTQGGKKRQGINRRAWRYAGIEGD